MHKQSDLMLTAVLVQQLYGAYSSAASSALWRYKSNVGIIWHINIDPVNFNRKYKALIKNQMAQFTR